MNSDVAFERNSDSFSVSNDHPSQLDGVSLAMYQMHQLLSSTSGS